MVGCMIIGEREKSTKISSSISMKWNKQEELAQADSLSRADRKGAGTTDFPFSSCESDDAHETKQRSAFKADRQIIHKRLVRSRK